jgi:hypothetical protein
MTQQRETKIFHLGDVLSVTTSMLLSPRYMDGVYELVRYLTGEQPAFDQLEATMVRCRPYLLALRPELEALDLTGIEFENWRGWLEQQTVVYGEWVEIARPLPGEIA